VTTAALAELVRARAADELSRRGLDSAGLPETVRVSVPECREHGHYTTNLALVGSGNLGVPARRLAGWFADTLRTAGGIEEAQVAGPGFVNLWLAPGAHWRPVRAALDAAGDYGRAAQRACHWSPPATVRTTDGASTTFAELVDLVGVDTARFAAARARGDPPRLHTPVAELRRQDERNPAYLVRYACARAAATVREATLLGIRPACGGDGPDHDCTGAVMRTLGELPVAVATPERLARYLERLAEDFLAFSHCRGVLPVGDARPDAGAAGRVAVCAAVRQALANGLDLLGVTEPERM
jgi:arginyl-tRNA synthetase